MDLADHFLAGNLQPFASILGDMPDIGARNELGCGVYKALWRRGEPEAAFTFLLSFCNWQDDPDSWIARFAQRLYSEEEDKTAALNLWMSLIQKGKGDLFAYEVCISSCVERGMQDQALALFTEALERFPLSRFSMPTKFNIAGLMHIRKEFDKAFTFYVDILSTEPDHLPSLGNITDLARGYGFQPAIDWIEQYRGRIAYLTPPLNRGTSDAPDMVVWHGGETQAIEAAIRAHGFCYIRGGCAPEVVGQLHQIALEYEAAGVVFPVNFPDAIVERLDRLFVFDPKAVLSRLSGADYNIDHSLCTMRKVTPIRTPATTPFHQDSTAFLRQLYNIWVPLTPAGGEYPSIQFVAKLIDFAEQTIITEGNYNQIEIDADMVAAKYGTLLRAVDDATPGDCVMFCGSTIHRSYGMESASKTRFNIEVRWS